MPNLNQVKRRVYEESSSASFDDYMNLFTEHEMHDAITKFVVIAFGESGAANTRQTTTRTSTAPSGITDIHSWELIFEEWVDTFGEPSSTGSMMMFHLMYMVACSTYGLINDGALPETCYDNALADAIIGAEDPAENEVETQFDLFTWNGIMQGMFISMMYYFAESTLVKMLEKTGFVMWYATDASLDPGSAYFLWGGFDFISGSYAAWGSDH